MIIPAEIFENLNDHLDGWTQNYHIVLGCESKLALIYKGNMPHAEFLGFPIDPEYDYDPEDDQGPDEDYDPEELERLRQNWRMVINMRFNERLELLSGEGYKVELLGNASDYEGFIFIID